ncbi:unnamed protein product [Polarella glacialis]|uniref:Uncharacterized protein n=1 Tax=Polarella glacialis TaxID=89957 RepID=A0A813GWB3_POLGL|nr:unnamed protein product [Polarella glacialis]
MCWQHTAVKGSYCPQFQMCCQGMDVSTSPEAISNNNTIAARLGGRLASGGLPVLLSVPLRVEVEPRDHQEQPNYSSAKGGWPSKCKAPGRRSCRQSNFAEGHALLFAHHRCGDSR